MIALNIIEVLKKHNYTIATAESLTAGLISANIADISGASSFLKGGVCSYTKEAKCELLGLNMDDINNYGVYSRETALQMARGIKNKLSSDVAVSTTGVAGPGSDEGVLAGTVYFGFIIKDKEYSECIRFDGSRNEVRQRAVEFVLKKIIELVK